MATTALRCLAGPVLPDSLSADCVACTAAQRSWNFFKGDIDEAEIKGQLDAMVVKRPVPGGKAPMSLLALGYNHVRLRCCRCLAPLLRARCLQLITLPVVLAQAGIDDGWQECDGYHVMPSNASAFHDGDGRPIVNKTK